MNFKKRFIYGLCDFDTLEDEIAAWHDSSEKEGTLEEYLGFTAEEFSAYGQADDETFKSDLLTQRREQCFRIYQLDLTDGKPKSFAFCGIDALHKAGYEQPPAKDYALVYQGTLYCMTSDSSKACLELIFQRFNERKPDGFSGRNIAPSDVIELYDENDRRYYYCDKERFYEVKFSPLLAKKQMK